MDNMNKQKPIATDISQWNNCTEIIQCVVKPLALAMGI